MLFLKSRLVQALEELQNVTDSEGQSEARWREERSELLEGQSREWALHSSEAECRAFYLNPSRNRTLTTGPDAKQNMDV